MSKNLVRRGGAKSRRTVGSGERRRFSASATGEAGGGGVGAAEIQKVLVRTRDGEGEGVYMDEARHGKGRVTSVCAGVRVGAGLGLYHKFTQGEDNFFLLEHECSLLDTSDFFSAPKCFCSGMVAIARQACLFL